MSKKYRKVTNFTLDLGNICTADIINKQDKMCAIGQYLYRCGYSKEELRLLNSDGGYGVPFKEITGIDARDVYNVNDDKKSSWARRIEKLKKVFARAGINLSVKAKS